jgi:fatty acid desaturase
MGWAEKRIQQYKEGQKATWLEKRALEHGNPFHCLLTIIATIAAVYGLWTHNWVWIIASLVLGFLGHLYCWVKK